MSDDEAANETGHTDLKTQLCDCYHVVAGATHDDQPSATPLPPLVWLSFLVMISMRSAAAVSAAATADCTVLA